VTPLGTPQASSDGALALDRGVPSLRKRIIRRLTTPKGAFAHLPGYGITVQLKGLIRQDTIMELQNEAETQIAREPDVAAVRVIAQQRRDAPNVVSLTARVRTTSELTDTITVDIAG